MQILKSSRRTTTLTSSDHCSHGTAHTARNANLNLSHQLAHQRDRRRAGLAYLLGAILLVVVAGLRPPEAHGSKVAAPSAPSSSEFYVSPTGSPNGDGSFANPWDLQTAIDMPPAVQPGDTIWMRGGTYVGTFFSRLRGNSAAPIILSGYPGEHATIDKARVDNIDNPLYVAGTYAWYRDFEVTNSNPTRTDSTGSVHRGNGVTVFGPYNKFINLVVHDTECGFGFWKDSLGSEIYGSIIYNNGLVSNGNAVGHGIYVDNTTDTKRIVDNVVVNNFVSGVHGYSETDPLSGLYIEGNVSADNGMPTLQPQANYLIAGSYPADHINLLDNHSYYPMDTAESGIGMHLGGWASTDHDLQARGNYLSGGYWQAYGPEWESVDFSQNTLYGARLLWQLNDRSVPVTYRNWTANRYIYAGASGSQYKWHGALTNYPGWRSSSGLDPDSTFATTLPTAPEVIIRPNRYEAGRANIIVWNWTRGGSVSVDLGGVLPAGTLFEIRNAMDYYGTPVLSGQYSGGPVTVPMSAAALSIATPFGWTRTTPSTAPLFAAFVVRSLECPGGSPGRIYKQAAASRSLAPAPSTPCAMNFSDVHAGDYFYTAVQYLFCGGVISGYADGTFRPGNPTTRGQIAKMVVLAEQWPLNTSGGPHFTDVPENHALYGYIETAFNRGVISGYADGTFRPGNNVTRGQLSKIVVLAKGWTLYVPPVPTFRDVPQSHPQYAYVETAAEHLIVSGYSCGPCCTEFRAGNTATRGQISKIVFLAVTQP